MAGAALEVLRAALRAQPRALDGAVERVMPPVFLRTADAKVGLGRSKYGACHMGLHSQHTSHAANVLTSFVGLGNCIGRFGNASYSKLPLLA